MQFKKKNTTTNNSGGGTLGCKKLPKNLLSKNRTIIKIELFSFNL